MKHSLKLWLTGIVLLSACSDKNKGGSVLQPQPPVDKNWSFETTPTWSDEFDYTGAPNPAKWDYDIGGNGW